VAEVLEELPETLARQRGGRDLAALVRLPQLFVDVPVRGKDLGRKRQPPPAEGRLERYALRAVRIEQRVIEVEKDGAGRQGRVTSRGR
jgi:hypothetical protein